MPAKDLSLFIIINTEAGGPHSEGHIEVAKRESAAKPSPEEPAPRKGAQRAKRTGPGRREARRGSAWPRGRQGGPG